MKIERVFVDMDGVLVDFVSGACRAFGRDPAEIHQNWPRGNYSVHGPLGLASENQMWWTIDADQDFWPNLELYPHADQLWRLLSFTADPVVLTSPSRNPASAYGKISLLREWKGDRFRNYALVPANLKHLLAGPGRLLVDDNEEVVDQWRNAGGEAILFPRLWNREHLEADKPLEAVVFHLAVLEMA